MCKFYTVRFMVYWYFAVFVGVFSLCFTLSKALFVNLSFTVFSWCTFTLLCCGGNLYIAIVFMLSLCSSTNEIIIIIIIYSFIYLIFSLEQSGGQKKCQWFKMHLLTEIRLDSLRFKATQGISSGWASYFCRLFFFFTVSLVSFWNTYLEKSVMAQ